MPEKSAMPSEATAKAVAVEEGRGFKSVSGWTWPSTRLKHRRCEAEIIGRRPVLTIFSLAALLAAAPPQRTAVDSPGALAMLRHNGGVALQRNNWGYLRRGRGRRRERRL